MNYRHAYHAGNFADVFKHVVLTRIIEHLKGKEKAFRVIDTHAGGGAYLRSQIKPASSGKPAEWESGAGRLAGWTPPPETGDLFEPYLAALFGDHPRHALPDLLPGSPLVALRCFRKQDRLTACEMHPETAAHLRDTFAGNFQVRVLNLDGWLLPGSQIPPKEKRGMMLIDPPFETGDDFDRMITALSIAAKRWPGGAICLWYPLKHARQVAGFHAGLRASGVRSLLKLELEIARPQDPPVLHGCGMIVRKPPFRLAEEMGAMLPVLTKLLETQPGAGSWRIDELAGE